MLRVAVDICPMFQQQQYNILVLPVGASKQNEVVFHQQCLANQCWHHVPTASKQHPHIIPC
jgi:hypothetical protein